MIADFHIHSDYSDGDSPPEEIVKMAVDLGMEVVAIVDHVNSTSEWVSQFCDHIGEIRERYADRICVLSGLEAKCSDMEGQLDIDPEVAKSADFVVGAIHRIPDVNGFMRSEELAAHADKALSNWMTSVSSMLANPIVDVWAHPGRLLSLNKIEIPPRLWEQVSSTAAANGKFAELSISAPEQGRIPIVTFRENGVRIIPGSDCHRMNDMPSYAPRCVSDEDTVKCFLDSVGRRLA